MSNFEGGDESLSMSADSFSDDDTKSPVKPAQNFSEHIGAKFSKPDLMK